MSTEPVTTLIARANRGDRSASEALYGAVYQELAGLARVIRRGEPGQTLDTSALVAEAWMKLSRGTAPIAEGRTHFKRIAGRAMRQVMVEEARRRNAAKRGSGAAPVTLREELGGLTTPEPMRVVMLDEALRELSKVDARASDVVECRFFAGMDVDETAEALGVSTATVKRDWRFARAWLAERVDEGPHRATG